MKRQTKIEIWVGAFVLMSIAALMMIAFQVSNFSGFKQQETYEVTALFDNIGGLKVRAPVKMSGVVIGRVTDISVDPISFKAKVQMNINQSFNELSEDSSASILTSGLLGDQYIGIGIGGSEDYLVQGSQIEFTQSAIVLEDLIGQFLVKFSEGE